MEEEQETAECVECKKKLELGVSVKAIQDGVIGPNGFVDLEDPIYVCSYECGEKYFSNNEVPSLPRRTP